MMKQTLRGVVIRDTHGNFVVATVSFVPHASNASMIEAILMKEGLALVASLGYHQIYCVILFFWSCRSIYGFEHMVD